MMLFVNQHLCQRFRWVALVMAFALIGGSYGWIQGVAWVGMTVRGIQQYQSIAEALDKTFDGSAPCSLCEAITQNQQESQESDSLFSLQKHKEIPFDQSRILILPQRPELGARSECFSVGPHLTYLPEIPPPRLV